VQSGWLHPATVGAEMTDFTDAIKNNYLMMEYNDFLHYLVSKWGESVLQTDDGDPLRLTSPDGERLGCVYVQPVHRNPNSRSTHLSQIDRIKNDLKRNGPSTVLEIESRIQMTQRQIYNTLNKNPDIFRRTGKFRARSQVWKLVE